MTGATMTALRAIGWACARDLKLTARSKSELALVLVFFVLVTSLFPLGVGPEPTQLRAIAPGIVWVCALLSALLALLVLPLAVPVLIFGAGAIEAAEAGMTFSAHLSLLGAGLIVSAIACPFAAAVALRVSLD